MSDMKKRDAGKTIQEKANVLWDVANSLAGLYKPHEYGLVILPMAVVKRFHGPQEHWHELPRLPKWLFRQRARRP